MSKRSSTRTGTPFAATTKKSKVVVDRDDQVSSVSSKDRPSKPEWIQGLTDVLEHKDNKDFLDASE